MMTGAEEGDGELLLLSSAAVSVLLAPHEYAACRRLACSLG